METEKGSVEGTPTPETEAMLEFLYGPVDGGPTAPVDATAIATDPKETAAVAGNTSIAADTTDAATHCETQAQGLEDETWQ